MFIREHIDCPHAANPDMVGHCEITFQLREEEKKKRAYVNSSWMLTKISLEGIIEQTAYFICMTKAKGVKFNLQSHTFSISQYYTGE